MQRLVAGAVSGLAGAAAMSAAMALGRRAGWLHPTLAEDSERWLNRTLGTTRRIGAAGAGFGALYGAGLYAANVAGVAPSLGITEGKWNAPTAQAAERLGLHLLFGVAAAVTLNTLNWDRR